MKRVLIGAALAAVLAFPALAGTPQSGWNAYLAGNYARAYSELKPLSDRGHPAAQYYLATLYAHGKGVERDEATALELYRKAAERGHGGAQFALGFALYQASDHAAAAKWLSQVARSNPTAASLVGQMYLSGRGVFQDDDTAFRYLTMAADAGDRDAQYLRAVMYADGRGTWQDLVEAYAWLSVLSFNDHPGAEFKLMAVKAQLPEEDMYAADARAGTLALQIR
jgi:uncharacterized protein